MIAFRKYFNWFLINFGFCLLPLFIALLISGNITDDLFLSFIAYSYTLVITSLYLFDCFRPPESMLNWLGFFLALILLASFVLYPEHLSMYLKGGTLSNQYVLCGIILLIVMIVSFFLNHPSIKEEIAKQKASTTFQKAANTEERTSKMFDKLKKEGQ